MEKYFNQRNGVRLLPDLKPGYNVRMKTDKESDWSASAKVLKKAGPRSYIVQTGGATYRRNRCHLKLCEHEEPKHQHSPPPAPARAATRSMSPAHLPALLQSHPSRRDLKVPAQRALTPPRSIQTKESRPPNERRSYTRSRADNRTTTSTSDGHEEVKSSSPRVTRSGRCFGP